jgi:hypothetical protein
MESFYQNWLEKNRRENEEVRGTINRPNNDQNLVRNENVQPLPLQVASNQNSNSSSSSAIPSTSQQSSTNSSSFAIPSTSQQPANFERRSSSSPTPSTSQQPANVERRNLTNQVQNVHSDLRNSIIYQNDKLQLYLEKGDHVHQIRFRLQDHLFYMKIRLLNPKKEPPLLRDIVEFLEMAFNHVLKEIRRFYKPEDHNVAFLTLFQEPMISGLNTGFAKI